MFRKIAIALVLVGVANPVLALTPDELKEFGLIPSERKKDMPKGKNPFSLIPIEQNSDSKLTQQENNEAYYLKIANSYMDKKEYKKAIEILDKAIALYPENSDFYSFRAISYYWLNQYKKAIEDYTKAINLNPQKGMLSLIYYGRGISYSELNQYEKAKFDLIKSSKLFREIGDVNSYNLAQESLKIIENNIAGFQQINQENSETYYLNIAYNLLREKKNKEAIEFLDKAIVLNSLNPNSYYSRGYAYNELKQYQKAIENYSKAINLNPQNAYLYGVRAESYQMLSQDQKVIEDCTKAIILDPQQGECYAVRGDSYNYLSQPQKAKNDFIKARELFQKKGNIDLYKQVQERLKTTEKNIALLASENASKKRTRELLVKRVCSLAKQGYTDGEIGNEIYRLVRINTPARKRIASSFSYGQSYGSMTIPLMNLEMRLDELSAQNYDNGIENEASDIMQVAKKRCKF